MVHAVRIVVRGGWSCEGSPDCGVEEMCVTNCFKVAMLRWDLVVGVFGAEEVLLVWGVFCGFRNVPLGVVREVCRFDVEEIVVM